MLGRLHFAPREYYGTSFADTMTAIEGFYDGEIAEMNKLRHLIAAPAWAMGGKINVRQIMPLPIDLPDTVASKMTKDEFLALDRKYKHWGEKAKA